MSLLFVMSNTYRIADMSKKPASKDWHKADIKAAIHKRDLTLKSITLAHGYHDPSACAQALHRPYPKAERMVAEALGLQPKDIWPSRYHEDGTPRSGRGERGIGRYKAKSTVTGNDSKVNLDPGA